MIRLSNIPTRNVFNRQEYQKLIKTALDIMVHELNDEKNYCSIGE